MSGSGRGWVIAVTVHALAVQTFAAAFRPALAYALIQADAGPWMLGVLAASFAVPALILSLPAGRFADLFGERLSAIVGALIILAGAVLALAATHSVPIILLASLVVGCGHMPSVVAEQALVANRSPDDRLDAMFGIYTLGASGGQLLGPLLLAIPGANPAVPPLDLVFACCVVVGVVLLVASLLMPRTPRSRSTAPEPGVLRRAGMLLRLPGVLRALVVGSIAVSVMEVVQVYWPAMGTERGLDAALVSLMLAARALATMASRVGLGWSVRLIGRERLMIGSLLVAAAALAVTAFPLPGFALVAIASGFGFAIGVCQPLTMSWLASITPPGNRGTTMSLRLAGNRISQAVIPVTLALLTVSAGAAGVVVASAVTLAATSLLVRSRGRDTR